MTTFTTNQLLIRGLIVGLIAGVLAGMFGVGGGIIIVPLYVMWLHVDQKLAHGTSLAAVIPIAVSGVISYASNNKVDWVAVAYLLSGSIIGARIGVHLLHRMSINVVRNLFAAILLISAARLLLDGQPEQLFSGIISHIWLIATGLFAGTMAGLLGVGGGIVMVPALMLGSGLQPAIARGTSLAVVLGSSISGTLAHRKKMNLDSSLALATGIAGVPAVYLGTYISENTPDNITVRLFAALLIITAVRLLRHEK